LNVRVPPVKLLARSALPLPVSVPSHCALMKPAAEKLAVELKKSPSTRRRFRL
jgi:malonyl CoA-acyl carrier protein transacylase